jgi:hypothetical protein
MGVPRTMFTGRRTKDERRKVAALRPSSSARGRPSHLLAPCRAHTASPPIASTNRAAILPYDDPPSSRGDRCLDPAMQEHYRAKQSSAVPERGGETGRQDANSTLLPVSPAPCLLVSLLPVSHSLSTTTHVPQPIDPPAEVVGDEHAAIGQHQQPGRSALGIAIGVPAAHQIFDRHRLPVLNFTRATRYPPSCCTWSLAVP